MPFDPKNIPLPHLELTSKEGSKLRILPYGAHVVSWIPAGRDEQLFLSEASAFEIGKPIRGGIPVVFPQFERLGPLPMHGFARCMEWDVEHLDSGAVSLKLRDSAITREVWDGRFDALLKVAIAGSQLNLELHITNTGTRPFAFTSALHTYLRVQDIASVQVENLKGCSYIDHAADETHCVDEESAIRFETEVDRTYPDAPSTVMLQTKERRMRIESCGFADTVVWNPGAERNKVLTDLEPKGYKRMVCVEAAAIRSPIHLAVNEHWFGKQSLEVV